MSKLVNQSQPFGVVKKQTTMSSTRRDSPTRNPLGATSMVENQGANQTQSNADKAPGAESYAHRNMDNPYAWTDKPKKGV